MSMEWILIGEIVATQGNKGEVRVTLHTDFPERFETMERVHLFKPESLAPKLVLALEGARFHKGFVILKLAGIDSINDALTLKGMQIKVSHDDAYPLPEGRHYIFDLIGLKVITTEGLHLGVITDVLQNSGANDVYVVRPRPGITKLNEILIPVIDQVVLDVDIAKQQVLVSLLDGLLE